MTAMTAITADTLPLITGDTPGITADTRRATTPRSRGTGALSVPPTHIMAGRGIASTIGAIGDGALELRRREKAALK